MTKYSGLTVQQAALCAGSLRSVSSEDHDQLIICEKRGNTLVTKLASQGIEIGIRYPIFRLDRIGSVTFNMISHGFQ